MYDTIRLVLAAGLCAILAACVPPAQQGVPDAAKLDGPISKDYLQIVSVAPELVEIDAGGRKIRAAAPEGLCIVKESIQTNPETVFMIFSSCPGQPESAQEGVLSLSVSKTPLASDLGTLNQFFATRDGIVGLGYGGGAGDVTLVDSFEGPRALYTVVEDRSEFGPAFAGDLISRAFTELNGRMTVLTLMSRRNETPEASAMRARLQSVVASLHAENA